MKHLSRRALFGLALAAPVAAVVPAVAPAKATVWSRWYEAGCISLNEMRLLEGVSVGAIQSCPTIEAHIDLISKLTELYVRLSGPSKAAPGKRRTLGDNTGDTQDQRPQRYPARPRDAER